MIPLDLHVILDDDDRHARMGNEVGLGEPGGIVGKVLHQDERDPRIGRHLVEEPDIGIEPAVVGAHRHDGAPIILPRRLLRLGVLRPMRARLWLLSVVHIHAK